MYHRHILTRDTEETTQKIYYKQKEESVKGDWYKLILKDFEFMEIDLNEEEIISTPKEQYKKKIKQLVEKAAFKQFMAEKVQLSKLNEVTYEKLTIQPYLTSRKFNNKERNLLYALRSRCHASKLNFRKMYKNDLKCTFGCPDPEDQRHTFTNCRKIRQRQNDTKQVRYENIFGSAIEQKEVITEFIKLEYTRLTLREELLPGGIDDARTQADPSGTAVVDS